VSNRLATQDDAWCRKYFANGLGVFSCMIITNLVSDEDLEAADNEIDDGY
jgi:hypothetical protein